MIETMYCTLPAFSVTDFWSHNREIIDVSASCTLLKED